MSTQFLCPLNPFHPCKLVTLTKLLKAPFLFYSRVAFYGIKNFPFVFQPELIRSYGYPVEEHEVVSEDGYVLTLHRIPHRKADSGSDPKIKVPVLLGHCMVASSAVWSLMPNHSLAYSLADSGEFFSTTYKFVRLLRS